MIKLIATDIDGTLLKEGSDSINPEYFEVISRLKEKGIIFAVASGRQFASIYNLFYPVKDDIVFVAENGGYVSGRRIDMTEIIMDKEIAKTIIKMGRKLPNCFLTVSAKDKMYLEACDETFWHLLVDGYHNTMEKVNNLLELEIDIIKVSIYKENGVSDIANQIIADWKDKIHVTVAGDIWIDFMDYGADKGKAVKSIQQQMNILPEETMVFGDNLNDMGMIKSAKESYAVGNARSEIREAAKYITDTNVNDGVLKILKKLL
jgi:HAD-superfamily hydrolase, subfamily IIB